jgi:hypothetical protein
MEPIESVEDWVLNHPNFTGPTKYAAWVLFIIGTVFTKSLTQKNS